MVVRRVPANTSGKSSVLLGRREHRALVYDMPITMKFGPDQELPISTSNSTAGFSQRDIRRWIHNFTPVPNHIYIPFFQTLT